MRAAGHGSVIVLVALVTMLMAVMTMVVLVAVVVVVIVAAAAGGAMGVLMRVVLMGVIMAVTSVGMIMAVAVLMIVMVVVPMIMAAATGVAMGVGMLVAMMIMAMVIVAAIGVIMVVGAALGLERPLDIGHRAALAADHLGQHMVVLDIDRVRGDLGRGVAVADMPGDTRQPQRILGGNLDQLLCRCPDQHERAVLELDGVAVVQRGRLVEIEQDVAPAIALERDAAAVAVLMVEGQRLDDPVLLDRGLADDGGGALHEKTRGDMVQRRSTDRGSTTSITGAAVTQVPAMARKAARCGSPMCRSASARLAQRSTLTKSPVSPTLS